MANYFLHQLCYGYVLASTIGLSLAIFWVIRSFSQMLMHGTLNCFRTLMLCAFLGSALAGLGHSAEASLRGVEDLHGTSISSLPSEKKPLVLIFMSVDCPIANRYTPLIQRLIQTNPAVRFVLVYPHSDEDANAIRRHLKEYALTAEAWRDSAKSLTKFAGATITPEAAVFTRGELVYRGRIDDQYSDWGKRRSVATKHDLQEVLDALAAGEDIGRRITQAVGCYISSVDE